MPSTTNWVSSARPPRMWISLSCTDTPAWCCSMSTTLSTGMAAISEAESRCTLPVRSISMRRRSADTSKASMRIASTSSEKSTWAISPGPTVTVRLPRA